jgi:hypothetical protein
MISSARFRRQVKLVLRKKCWQRWKNSCCYRNNPIGSGNAEEPVNSIMEVEEIK